MAQAQLKALVETPTSATSAKGQRPRARAPMAPARTVESPRLLMQQLQRTRFLYSMAGIIISALFFACLYYFRRDELSEQGVVVLFLSSWLSVLMFLNAAKLSGEIKILTIIQALDDTKSDGPGSHSGPRAG